MSHAATDSASVVSPTIYSLIATSPRLRRMLLPEGILASPYEVLDYDATLTLGDTKGIKADFQRTETVRFLQSGVAGILDHVWGDGVALAYYHNEAGNLEDSFNDQGRRHLVIGFKRAMRRGETMKFDVMRTAMVGFTEDEEWLETSVDHPVRRLGCAVVFPKGRPCQSAMLHYEGKELALPIIKLGEGRGLVRG